MARRGHMNPYDYHKYLINQYVLKRPGDTRLINSDRDIKYKSDTDIALLHLKFIWNEEDKPRSWEERLAKKYYDKLFREYCICDLSRYKENKIANRFRVEKEVVNGKGQFVCGEKACNNGESLKTWEVNFNYIENGEKKNALVKIRLCESCSEKLNYHSKKREIKRLKRRKVKSPSVSTQREPSSQPQSDEADEAQSSIRSEQESVNEEAAAAESSKNIRESPRYQTPADIWKEPSNQAQTERADDFDEYLADLLM